MSDTADDNERLRLLLQRELEKTREDMKEWTGCIAGALTRHEFESGLAGAGFVDIQIEETLNKLIRLSNGGAE